MKVLGIETSCDETCAAVVVDGRKPASNVIASQVDLHKCFGGVVPEVASRRHVEVITAVVESSLSEAGMTLRDVDAIAVTRGPGLEGSLLVGVCAAKAYALALDVPLVGVNHIEGHLHSVFLQEPQPEFPLLCLVVSGGHSDIILMRDHGDYLLLGQTRDDAAGEAFDKIGRFLGLGYPGGPAIDRAARSGDPHRFDFPRTRFPNSFDFSFSGLKTAVVRQVQGLNGAESDATVADIAASFQEAVVDMLVENTLEAARETGVTTVSLGGGVAANSSLRKRMSEEADTRGLHLLLPAPELCTDNAAMIASAGYYRLVRGQSDTLFLSTDASLRLNPSESHP